MKYKTITSISSILTLINAFFFLFLPEFSLLLLGRTTNNVGLLNTRISGACAAGLGVFTWTARKSSSKEVQKLVSLGNLTAFGLLLVVDFYGVSVSAINAVGWLIFGIDLLIFLGFMSSVYKN